MLRLKIECKCGIEKVFEWLQKLEEKFEYKIWEYNNNSYLLLKVSNLVELKEIIGKLRQAFELRFLRVDYSLPWWMKWMKMMMF
jgi:hypothetical protein